MRDKINPDIFYGSRIGELNKLLKSLSVKKSRIAWARVASVLAIFLAAYFLWPFGALILIGGFILFFVLFLRLVVIDSRNKAEIENTNQLLRTNEEELKILNHQFLHREDGGRFLQPDHDYAGDLDIFGRASLYQFTNRATSEQGKKEFANWLSNPADRYTILKRQLAAQELTEMVPWRQQLLAFGLSDQLTLETQARISIWIYEKDYFLRSITWKWLRYILPVIILSLLLLHILGIIGPAIFYSMALIFFLLSGYVSKLIKPLYEKLNKIAGQVETLSNSAGWIEETVFRSEMLQDIQKGFLYEGKKASKDIRQLKRILDKFDLRLNPLVFIILNTFLFWDLQQVFSLEKWKNEHREKINGWFLKLGEMEAISSIANLAFNHPYWCYPVMSKERGTFDGIDLGHPLIGPGKLVRNSFSTQGTDKISLVTGSNMAGKSTFLRTIGVNTVLAVMGSPVYANSLCIFPVKIMSSMRVNDNLEENTSTFYAELKKLKHILESVNDHKEIFILLDEILRGTNSFDRHAGSKALIKQLIRHDAVGILATHDLELARLADEFPGNIKNYHFDVQVANDELYFDYKLKPGICQSFNASILMKNMGIEL
jgi:MutS domain V